MEGRSVRRVHRVQRLGEVNGEARGPVAGSGDSEVGEVGERCHPGVAWGGREWGLKVGSV